MSFREAPIERFQTNARRPYGRYYIGRFRPADFDSIPSGGNTRSRFSGHVSDAGEQRGNLEFGRRFILEAEANFLEIRGARENDGVGGDAVPAIFDIGQRRFRGRHGADLLTDIWARRAERDQRFGRNDVDFDGFRPADRFISRFIHAIKNLDPDLVSPRREKLGAGFGGWTLGRVERNGGIAAPAENEIAGLSFVQGVQFAFEIGEFFDIDPVPCGTALDQSHGGGIGSDISFITGGIAICVGHADGHALVARAVEAESDRVHILISSDTADAPENAIGWPSAFNGCMDTRGGSEREIRRGGLE